MTETATPALEAPPARTPRSLWGDAWRRLLKNKLAVVSLVWLAIISVLAALAPWIVPFDPDHQEWWISKQAPLYHHATLENVMRFEAGQPAPSPFKAATEVVLKIKEINKRDARVEIAANGTVVRIELGPDYNADNPASETPDRLALEPPLSLVIEGKPPLSGFTIEKEKLAPPQLGGAEAGERTIVAELRKGGEKTHELLWSQKGAGPPTLTFDQKPVRSQEVSAEEVESAAVNGADFSHTHLLGTDDAGRDILSRVIFGGRISLLVGIVATFFSLVIGVAYGAISGYYASAPVTVGDLAGLLIVTVGTIAAIVFLGAETVKLLALTSAQPAYLATAAWVIAAAVGGVVGFRAFFGVAPWAPLSRVLPWKVTTVDDLLMRLVDILYAIPFMFFVIILLVLFGRNLFLLFAAIGAVEWLTMARIVRGQVLSLKEKEFVEAAKTSGTSNLGIVFGHLIPNSLGPVIVYTTLTIPEVILTEAFLSFLGLSVQYNDRALESWGSLTETGMHLALGGFPWLLVWSATALSLTLFALNFLGDGLRDALDPRLRGRG